jgi:hypothetical protein
VAIDDASGVVLEAWTGPQVAWKMARGYSGQFGHKLNAPYVWLPLCALFVVPFVNVRRRRRLLHLDLAVLLAFGASHYFFNKADIAASTPLAYPVLVYLLVRLLWEGFRPRRERGRLIPHVPVAWLTVMLVFLVGFRVALNVSDSGVIDVGYAGVIGANHVAHGRGLYDGFPANNQHGDTYGAANYLAYVPFERAFPWSGKWDDLPAAHAAAIAFDLLTLIGLLVLGRRLRNRELGLALAYAWAAYPYTDFALQSNSNDTLVAAVLVWALVLLRSPPARGLLVGIGAAAKFVPLALAPLFAGASAEHRRRDAAITLAAVAAVIVFTFVPFLTGPGVSHVWDRTIGYQLDRNSPFSIWGQHTSLEPLHIAVIASVGVLALLVAFVPRRKSPLQLAALAGAVMVAIELTADHWFYLYIVWFAPLVLVAAFLPLRSVPPPREDPLAVPRADEREPALVS